MFDLTDYLEDLHTLNEVRDNAKELREQGLHSLRRIEDTRIINDKGIKIAVTPMLSKKPKDELSDEESKQLESDQKFFEDWICSGNEIEAALLAKVQNHRNFSQYEEDNDNANASADLTKRLLAIDLKMLLPSPDTQDRDATVPVLVAARALQALTARPETVFSEASMFCYYRIIREIYYASKPDWTIGAARAGRGGRTSAFVTSDCIRAVFAFESAISRTSEYFRHTLDLYNRYLELEAMLECVGITYDAEDSTHPLSQWADKAIERMWLDWYISTNSRNGAIALYCEGDKNKILPFPPNKIEPPDINMQSVRKAFLTLKARLIKAIDTVYQNVARVREEIHSYREKEPDELKDRTESAYRMAFKVIDNTYINAEAIRKKAALLNRTVARQSDKKRLPLRELLEYLLIEYTRFPSEIHRVLEPAKRYVHTVLDRELAIAHSGQGFDAGELVFAATAFGAATNWHENEKLKQACDFLVKVLPDSGRFATSRPFHADRRGYKLLPIGCEMTRSFAKLLNRTGYEFKPDLAKKMLNIFLSEKQFFPSLNEHGGEKRAGWSFENAPYANTPFVWVTAISVQALDRIVRMLNDRINEIVFKHFKVIRPENPHTNLTLNTLVYPDYGLMSKYYGGKSESRSADKKSIAIRLEQMRAHVMRASLPDKYKKDQEDNKEKVFSAILYGPPGTGKTSLLEALALSSNVPLVMLSPSDLIVQGQEQLEGRAKAVFDALSMLSQAVILFDEFEPVLRRRAPKSQKDSKQQDDAGRVEDLTELTSAIRDGGAYMLKFLLTGMLPKLVSLHDAAEKQSLVYCLGTNHLEEIDDAAKRRGRFDVHQPIYNPDPISRAGTFLFRLQPIAEKLGKRNFLSNPDNRYVFASIIAATANENAGELSGRLFKLPKLKKADRRRPELFGEDKNWSFFAYVLGEGKDQPWFEKRVKEISKNFKKMEEEFKKAKGRLDDDEKLEREWLCDFENQLRKRLPRFKRPLGKGAAVDGKSKDFLEFFLRMPTNISK